MAVKYDVTHGHLHRLTILKNSGLACLGLSITIPSVFTVRQLEYKHSDDKTIDFQHTAQVGRDIVTEVVKSQYTLVRVSSCNHSLIRGD